MGKLLTPCVCKTMETVLKKFFTDHLFKPLIVNLLSNRSNLLEAPWNLVSKANIIINFRR